VLAVAFEALAVGHAFGVEDPSDLVRLVALYAGGHFVWLLLPEYTFDDLLVHLLDASVAGLAGGRDVIAVNRRARVGMRQY